MNAVILAGGYGTRLAEESGVRPKPMVEIGGRPILWHIMKIYSAHGINEFIVCCGYRGDVIKDFFANYFLHVSDVRFDLSTQTTTRLRDNEIEPWTVTLIDTGEATMTGGRIKRVAEYIGDETFCLTYGDCVAAIDIVDLISFHREQGVLATLTAIQPPGRFGAVALGPEDTKISPLEQLAEESMLAAYKHRGYWQSMDTLRDKMVLEADWESGSPWKVW